MAAAVEIAAGKGVDPALALAGPLVAVFAFWQGVGGPGLVHLALGHPLVEVAVAVGTPQALVGVDPAEAAHVVAGMTGVAISGKVGVVGEDFRIFHMPAVNDVGKGVARGRQTRIARRPLLAHGRVEMADGTADGTGDTVTVGIEGGEIDA